MAKELVLVTGASGHLGFRTLVLTLQAGYRTRVPLRRLEQAEKIKKMPSIQPHVDSIEFVQVPDITAPDAYVEAIKGVDYVLHIASPIHTGIEKGDTDWQKLLYDPSKKGATSMLHAAAKEPSVKRVVITSSVVVLEAKNGNTRVGPHDLAAVPDEEALKNFTVPAHAYRASKVMSHHAGDDFMREHKPTFDLVRVLPGYIQGANELYTSAEQMRDDKNIGSNEGIINVALGRTLGHPRVTAQVFLDDVANAHLYALRRDVAKGGDNIVVAGNGGDGVAWQEYVPVVERLFPDAVAKRVLSPKAEDESMISCYDVTSSEKALGFKFAGAETMVKSLVGQYLKLAEQE